ncbi:MAG: NADH-quinone oxidoreductase subunit NuoE [Bdellovibrionales bacterium]
MSQVENFSLSHEGVDFIKKEMDRYEKKQSCLLPALYQIQKEKGWIPPEAVPWLSEITSIPKAHIYEILMFYTLFNKKPVGSFHIQVCCNVSCALKGSRELLDQLCNFFNVKEDQMSENGKFTISKVECLGACDEAPVMQVNDEYFGKLEGDKALQFLKNKMDLK